MNSKMSTMTGAYRCVILARNYQRLSYELDYDDNHRRMSARRFSVQLAEAAEGEYSWQPPGLSLNHITKPLPQLNHLDDDDDDYDNKSE
jgi:hypothetical protein